MAICQYHRDRPGVGVCMRCRAVVCDVCRTRVDGVNHCHACLEALGRNEATAQRQGGATGVALLVCGVAWAVLSGALSLLQGWLAP